jgi:hypothetical protein
MNTVSNLAKECFAWSSYYIMLAILILLSVEVFKLYSKSNFSLWFWLKKNNPDILFIFALTVLSLFWLHPEMRVLADEMNLVNVSRSLFYTKTPLIVDQSLIDFGIWRPISWNYPIRPLMFPFVLHLLHLFFGYQIENAFVLNNLLFGLLLGVIYFGFRHYSNRIVAASATISACSIPLLRLCATSAGFDLMAVVCLVLLTLISISILNGREELFSLNWCLWLTFINIRYESIALFFIAFIFFFYYRRVGRRTLSENPIPYIFTPIALIPLVLQFIFSQGSYENPQGTALLSFSHFFNHLFLMIRNQVHFNTSLPFNHLINVISLLLFVAVLFFSKETWQKIKNNWSIIFFVCTLWVIQTGIFLAHFMGDYTLPTQFRFFLGFSIFTAVFPGLLLLLNRKLFKPYIYLICSCCCCIFYQSQPAVFPPDQGMTKAVETEYLRTFLKKNDFKNAVMVSEDPAIFVGMNHSAVTFKYFEENSELFLRDLKTKKFSDLLVVRHKFDTEGVDQPTKSFAQKIEEEEQTKMNLKLQVLETTQLNDHVAIVISRISGL